MGLVKCGQLGGIIRRGVGVDLNLPHRGPRRGDFRQRGFLEISRAGNGRDKIGDEISPAFAQAADAGAGGVIVVYDPSFFVRRRDLADAASGKRIATVFNFREFVEAGGLVSYGPNAGEMCRQSARLIKKVLDGARAGEIPMEQPTRFELIVNLKTARAIGVEIPPTLLALADDVIE